MEITICRNPLYIGEKSEKKETRLIEIIPTSDTRLGLKPSVYFGIFKLPLRKLRSSETEHMFLTTRDARAIAKELIKQAREIDKGWDPLKREMRAADIPPGGFRAVPQKRQKKSPPPPRKKQKNAD